MPLNVGETAPDFKLPDISGREVRISDLDGFKMLTFYKVTCPTCQLTLPFVEKIHKAYGSKVHFLGIVQDPPEEADRFRGDYGLTFPQLIDAPDYRVSLDYKVEVVPTLYLINPEGRILFVEESFLKAGLEKIVSEMALITGEEEIDLFAGANVPPFKAG